jgi:hypothetical protein
MVAHSSFARCEGTENKMKRDANRLWAVFA